MATRNSIPVPNLTPRRVFSPPQRAVTRCTHTTVVRLYDQNARCCECQETGQFGWLYQCTEDIEDLIEDYVRHGDQVTFDSLGAQLCQNMIERRGSPSARENNLSFLREVSSKELAQYRPEQIETILRQRDNVPRTIRREQFVKNGLEILDRVNRGETEPTPPKPWVKDPSSLCVYCVCSSCRPYYHERSYLSLDAILKGETPPAAAVGFGFHRMLERPVADANVVKSIGKRRGANSSECSVEDGDKEEGLRVVGLLQTHIEREEQRWKPPPAEIMEFSTPKSEQHSRSTDDRDIGNFEKYHTHGTLRHSPRCDNLASISMGPLFKPLPCPVHQSEGSDIKGSTNFSRHLPRPLSGSRQACAEEHDVSLHEAIDLVDGGGDPSSAAKGKLQQLRLPEHQFNTLGGNWKDRFPVSEETAAEVDPLAPGPLKVAHSAALTEESVEIKVPDVITEKT